MATGSSRPGVSGDLPARSVGRAAVTVDVSELAAYARVCGMTLRNALPATYLHVLTFPLQVHLMAARDFPFAMAGMVHVANTMTLHRPVDLAETLTLSTRAVDVRPHRRGVTVDLLGLAEAGGERVWEGRSTYLVRGGSVAGEAGEEAPLTDASELPWRAQWRLPAELGRRYAAAAGDVNPIHLTPVAARAFGFPRAIAHGMWTHARVLAALEGRLPPAYGAGAVPQAHPAALDRGAAGADPRRGLGRRRDRARRWAGAPARDRPRAGGAGVRHAPSGRRLPDFTQRPPVV